MSEDTTGLLKKLQEITNSKVISIIYPPEIAMEQPDVDELYEMVREIGPTDKISVVIFSYGGDANAAYKMIVVLRDFCKEMQVLVPSEAKSATTLFCLGADKILMGIVSELGPIDPIVSHPMIKAWVPARSILKFMEDYLESYGKAGAREMPFVPIDPIHLGYCRLAIDSAQEYLKVLLLKYNMKGESEKKINDVIKQLTVGYKSHGYVIDFVEATRLGLKVEKMSPEIYDILWELYRRYRKEIDERIEEEEYIIILENEKRRNNIVKSKPKRLVI